MESLMSNWKNKCEGGSVPHTVPEWQGSNCNMADVRLSFEERKQIIVCDVHKGRSWRPCTATSDESTTAVLELFQRSPQKIVAARESDVSASSVLRILRKGKFHVYIPRLVQQLNLSGHFGTMYGINVGSYSAMY
ncbi:protein tssc1 [Biomphalaria glabrata]|nr:protein tssc1 [Biomphalaria glabrata]